MALVDSRSAIGELDLLLRSTLVHDTSAALVDIGRPEASATGTAGPKYNLFLYQLDHDGHLRNRPLDAGQQPPIWLVAHYLLTAYDEDLESDSELAHNLLGEGLIALREMNFIHPTAVALSENPEPLKVTFDSADADLLSKLMQGADEKYRCSSAFQVRPLMIAGGVPPAYVPLVKTVGPADEGAEVVPSLGPVVEAVTPERFEAGDEIALSGTDLGDAEEICLGATCFGVTAAPAGQIKTVIPSTTTLSAGSYPIFAVKTLASGRRFSSNAVIGHFAPTVSSAAPGALTVDGSGNLSGDLAITGVRLGGTTDAIFVAFYRDGAIALMVEAAGSAAQTTLTASVASDQALPSGDYLIIVRVNGQQAVHAPLVDWS